ncbi:MAG: TetR/AcrR family transcriptional regulator [Polyangiales bacterium]
MPRSDHTSSRPNGSSSGHGGQATTHPAKKRARKKRDPRRTRESILEAARVVLAQDGKEGLSVAEVAKLARVNRGTAYQHFQTREQLIEATATWVSDKLYRAVFGDPNRTLDTDHAIDDDDVQAVNDRLATFAMENPALGRVWLFEVLSSRRPANDPFWRQYESSFERFAKTGLAQPEIDVEVLSVLFLAAAFIWPVWARAHARSAKERQQMAERFSREVLRLTLHGTLRPEKYPTLDARVTRKRRES